MDAIAVTIAEPHSEGWTARGDDGSTWLVPASALGTLRTLRTGQRLRAEVNDDRVVAVFIGPREEAPPAP